MSQINNGTHLPKVTAQANADYYLDNKVHVCGMWIHVCIVCADVCVEMCAYTCAVHVCIPLAAQLKLICTIYASCLCITANDAHLYLLVLLHSAASLVLLAQHKHK